MSAGTGVIHSEFNASPTEPVHFLQIWIVPSVNDLEPSYQQFRYDPSEKRGRLRLIAGPDRKTDPPSAFIHQDARMYATVLGAGESVEHAIAPQRHAWVQCASGHVVVNGHELEPGDGAAISDERMVSLRGSVPDGAEVLLFDLA
jgi:hypothetical protein